MTVIVGHHKKPRHFPLFPGCSFTGPLLEIMPVDRKSTAVLKSPRLFVSSNVLFLLNDSKGRTDVVNPRNVATSQNN